jgi:hypothetical protein
MAAVAAYMAAAAAAPMPADLEQWLLVASSCDHEEQTLSFGTSFLTP